MSEFVTLFEVGPRDGLQNEKQQVSTTDKIHMIDLLSQCGFKKIEASSFVSPKWVPQLADAREVMQGIQRFAGVTYSALTPNLRGFESALRADVDEVAIFAAASETFSQKNINCSIDESIERFRPIMLAAEINNIPVRGYVSCVVDCPYEGAVAPENVLKVAEKLMQLGCYQVSLGDTTGRGTPETIADMLDTALSRINADQLAGHYHDTGGQGLANIKISLDYGIRTFDAAVAGLGGCPYAPGARGNVATELVVQLLPDLGYSSGIDLQKLKQVKTFAQSLVSPSSPDNR